MKTNLWNVSLVSWLLRFCSLLEKRELYMRVLAWAYFFILNSVHHNFTDFCLMHYAANIYNNLDNVCWYVLALATIHFDIGYLAVETGIT